jgi:hypothetical protein
MVSIASVSLAAFSVFSEAASLAGVSVQIILDRSVEVIDEDGNVKRLAGLIHASKADFPSWARGAVLVTSAGNFTLRELIVDDGYILQIEVSPGGTA